MKRIKRLASLLLAMVMALAMTMTAFATDAGDTPQEQTPEKTTTHTYEIYQIFTGDYSEGKLSNIRWGQNGTGIQGEEVGKNVLEALAAVMPENDTANVDTAQLAVIKNYAVLPPAENAKAPVATKANVQIGKDTKVKIEGLAQGYYLVMDKPDSLANTLDSAYTLYVVQVSDGTLEFTPKAEVPSGDKQTYIVGEDGTTYTPSDSNYGTIGSHVSYVITSAVPDHTNYDYYYFIMNDTLDKGLVFDGSSNVKVTVGGTETTAYHIYTENVTPYSFRLAFDNIKDFTVGATIVVTYSATITDEVEKIGVEGNANTWQLQYSNNPNEDYSGTIDENNPGLPLEENRTVLGKTPEEKTLTYLTELDITKYRDSVAEDHLLAGAEFTLTGTSYQVVLSNVDYYRKATDVEKADEKVTKYYKLLALNNNKEQYTTAVPTNTQYVKIGVGTKDTTTGYLLNAEENSYYVPENKDDYNGKDVYKLVKGTDANYADVNVTYVKDSKTETSVVPVDVAIEMTTGDDGKISFKGLGAGTYTLTETVTPAGFNTLAPVTITIDFTAPAEVKDGTEKCTWAMTSSDDEIVKISEGSTKGIFVTDVVNKSGSLLPSTGGIGTTIFYVVGAVLVIGAGILLVTKKRMSAR